MSAGESARGTHLPRSVKIARLPALALPAGRVEPEGDAEPGAGLRALPGAGAALPGHAGAPRGAVQRHLTFFNTHPYVAAAIVGGVLYHEERIARRRGGRPAGDGVQGAPDGPAGRAGRRVLLALAPAGRRRVLRRAGARAAAPGPRCSSSSSTTSSTSPCARGSTAGPASWGTGWWRRWRGQLPTRGARLRAVAAASAGAAAAWLAIAFGARQGRRAGALLAGGWLAAGGGVGYVWSPGGCPIRRCCTVAAGLAGCLRGLSVGC